MQACLEEMERGWDEGGGVDGGGVGTGGGVMVGRSALDGKLVAFMLWASLGVTKRLFVLGTCGGREREFAVVLFCVFHMNSTG